MACFEVTVKALILQEGRILLCKSPSGIVLPGGKKEPEETLEEALLRELEEELGVKARIRKLLYAQAYKTPAGKEKVGIYYLVEISGSPRAEAEIEELFWVSPQEILKLKAPEGLKDLLSKLLSVL